MFGKGLFIYKIKNASGGDVALIAERAAQLRLNFIAVKVNRGYWSYNWREIEPGNWVDDFIPRLKAALTAKGIDLYGWGDAWLLDGKREAEKAKERIEKHGLAGYFIDAEGQAKHSPNRKAEAIRYANVIRMIPGPVLLCSYRYPSMHHELPWAELLAGCTHHAPQVYWVHGSQPKLQLERSMLELQSLRELPFVPAGPAYNEHGWRPTNEEVNQFNEACQERGCEGVIWWEYDEAEDNDFFQVIAAHEWPNTPKKTLTIAERVADLEGRVDVLEGLVVP